MDDASRVVSHFLILRNFTHRVWLCYTIVKLMIKYNMLIISVLYFVRSTYAGVV